MGILNEKLICSICLEDIPSNGKEKYITECNHKFHTACIEKSIVSYMNDKCPLCRTIIDYVPDSKNKENMKLLNEQLLNNLRNEFGRIHRFDLAKALNYFYPRNIFMYSINNSLMILDRHDDDHKELQWNWIEYRIGDQKSTIVVFEKFK